VQLAGIAALVTGGGSGLGMATARALAGQGVKVALIDADLAAAETVAAEIGGIAFAADVTDPLGLAQAIEAAQVAHGVARVLVHCAGIVRRGRILGRDGPLPLDQFRLQVEVNLIGTFNALRLFAAPLQKAEALSDGERGVVVMTASVAAMDGQIGQAAYAASKGGVAALTLPAAREFAAYGIRVCTIAPGLFETPILRILPEAAKAEMVAGVPFPARLGRPDEFAGLALHIIENAMLNGAVIRLDGALRLPPT